MPKLSYVRSEVMYTNQEAHVTIYKGCLQTSNLQIAIKEEVFPTLAGANQALQEALNMARLTHPSICKIYDAAIEEAGQGAFKSIIITELLGSDVFKQIGIRKQTNQPWTEAELMGFLRDLVSALSFAQKTGVSHRDIKPQNIFSSADGTVVKIGDFGSAVSNVQIRMIQTLQGSPFYLSPELKRMYAVSLTTGDAQNHVYDPYKSDVYSLGVTLLYMATLESPNELMNQEKLADVTERLVSSMVNYPSLQYYVRLMLTISAQERPNFIDLDGLIQNDAYGNSVSSQGSYQQSAPVAPWGNAGSPQVVSQEFGNYSQTVQEKQQPSPMFDQYQPGPYIQQPLYHTVQERSSTSPQAYQQPAFQFPPERTVEGGAYLQQMQGGQLVAIPRNPAPQTYPGYPQGMPQQSWSGPMQLNPQQIPASPVSSSGSQYDTSGRYTQTVSTVQGTQPKSPQLGSPPVQAASINQFSQDSVTPSNLKYCQKCHMPFLYIPGKESAYCSGTCNPQKTIAIPQQKPNAYPQTTSTNKSCAMCPSLILIPLRESEVPPELQMFMKFVPYCCSMKCLARYQEIAAPELVEDYKTCVNCSWKATPYTDGLQIIVLQCKHCFHNKDCFFHYLKQVSRNFSARWIDIICPRCRQKSDYNYMISNAFGFHYFDHMRDTVRKASCCVCGSEDLRKQFACGHLLCGFHLNFYRCSYCNK